MTLNEHIKAFRTEWLCITQAELARLLKVTKASIISWESGRRIPGSLSAGKIKKLMKENMYELER